MFQHSPFKRLLDRGKWPKLPSVEVRGVSVPPYGVCDGTYPCKPYLVKPFRGAEITLSRSQRNFNFCQSSTRQPIEHVNGILKRRWRNLVARNELWKKKDAVNCILSCIIINNLLTMRGNYDHDPFSDDESDEDEEPVLVSEDTDSTAASIRDALAAHLASL